MKLYTFDAAPNPARLGKFMQYKGISLDTVQIDLGAEEQLSEAYRAIVPEATVPALVLDDGTVDRAELTWMVDVASRTVAAAVRFYF